MRRRNRNPYDGGVLSERSGGFQMDDAHGACHILWVWQGGLLFLVLTVSACSHLLPRADLAPTL